jgi:hypothetical protein
MASLQAGVMLVRIGGEDLQVEGTFTVNPAIRVRTAKTSLQGNVSFTTTPQPAMLKATIQVFPGVDADMFGRFLNTEAEVRLDGGRVYSFTGLTSTGNYEHNVVDGTVDLECFAQTCTTEDP